MRFFMVLIMTAWVAGCTVGPDYIRPNINAPAAYRFEDKEARDTANTQWWRQFQDPVLDALIIEALLNNKNIRLAAANVEKAAGVLTQTRSPLFPQDRLQWKWNKATGKRRGRDPRALFGDQPADHVSVARQCQLGDRSVGPHPATVRSGAGGPSGYRGGKAGCHPFSGIIGSRQLYPAPGSRHAADDFQAHACHIRRVGQDIRIAIQIRPGVADEPRAGAYPIRNSRRDDSADRVADRPDGKRALDPAWTKSGTHSTRQNDF